MSSSSDDSDDSQNDKYDTVMNRLPDEFFESAVATLGDVDVGGSGRVRVHGVIT